MQRLLIILCSSFLVLTFTHYVFAVPPVERPTHEKAIPGNFIIYVDPSFDKGPVKNFVKSKGAMVAYDYVGIPAMSVKSLPEAALEGLSRIPGVSRIWQDREVKAYLVQSIPQISADAIGVDGAYGYDIKVCILDTGIDNSHPAFGSRIVAQKDFVNNDDDAQDDEGHGTHVAGIVASEDSTYRGVARGVSLIAGKVLNASGSGSFSDVIAGIDWCAYIVDADIINMSLGGGIFANYCDTDPAAQASNAAVTSGVVVVAASGNDGLDNAIGTPACGSKVIAVGGVYDSNWQWVKWGCIDPNCSLYMCKDEPAVYDTRFCASNGGPQLDVVAPGMHITSALLGGGWTSLGGTSMATPHVAGLAALLLEKNRSLEPSEVQSLIRNNAIDKGTPGFDYIYGYGRIDAKATWDAVTQNTAECGNNVKEAGEECDGTDLAGETCESLGYGSGNLSCTSNCTYDVNGCASVGFCGDGVCAGQTYGEDCNTCPLDCSRKNTGKPSNRWCCGDSVCGNGEAEYCPVDCGNGSCETIADCDDGNTCTNDICDIGTCQNIWPACGISDGCCGPGCTPETDLDCEQCLEFKQGFCDTDLDCCAGLTCHPIKHYCR